MRTHDSDYGTRAKRGRGGIAAWPIAVFVCFTALLAYAADDTRVPMLDEVYQDYKPEFSNAQPAELMKTSIQSTYFNRAYVIQDSRVNGFIQQGIKCEKEKDYRKAIGHYQTVIEKFPESLIQVSDGGVFGPAALYVQQRLLRLPPAELNFYRLNYDPQARDLLQAARARHSIVGIHEIAAFHRATSYGAKALYELGVAALDMGYYDEAAEYLEQIRDWHPEQDMDPIALRYQLAFAYRLLNRKKEFDGLLGELRSRLAKEKNAGAWNLDALAKLTPDAIKGVAKRTDIATRPFSFSEYTPVVSMKDALSSDSHVWNVELPRAPGATQDDRPSDGELLPFHNPSVSGHSIFYKHYNRIYCRSIVTGRLRWSFEVGPVDRDITRLVEWGKSKSYRWITQWYSDQGILVDEERVYANVRAYGRRDSLVALDRVTGEMRWGAGAIRPLDENDMTMRYDATPALGVDAVFVPWSRDEGEGSDHIYTAVGLSALTKETGEVRWRVPLCQLSPTATTQSKSGIRVLSSTPLVQEGVIYCATNAGVVAALDEASGNVRWLVRYPHCFSHGDRGGWHINAHDDISFFQHQHGPHFNNRPPLLIGDLLIVTPTDSDHMLCIDRRTGMVKWSNFMPNALHLAGLTSKGELIVAQSTPYTASFGEAKIELYEPQTGKKLWDFTPTYTSTWAYMSHDPGEEKTMRVLGCPVLAQDDKLYFCTMAAPPDSSGYHGGENPTYAEWCLSLKDRKLVDNRVFFRPLYRDTVRSFLRKQIKDSKDFSKFVNLVPPQNKNSPYPYDPVRRLPFNFHGVAVEVNTSGQSLSANLDLDELEKEATAGKSAAGMFTRAEILLARGNDREALNLFEKCKEIASPEDGQLIRMIDRELNTLYGSLAWQARLANDKAAFHQRCLQTAATATTVRQEIQAMLSIAESYEMQGQLGTSARILRSLIRNYAGIPVDISANILEARGENEKLLAEAVGLLSQKKPQDMAAPFDAFEKGLRRSVPSYFSAAAPVASDMWVDAEGLALKKLNDLLTRDAGLRAEFEKDAQENLGQGQLPLRANAVRAFPGVKAAQAVIDDLVSDAAKLAEGARYKSFLEIYDLAGRLNLKLPQQVKDAVRFEPVKEQLASAPPSYAAKNHSYEDATQVLRLTLPNRGDEKPNLLFVGGRQKKRLDNKFTLQCWDVENWKPLWDLSNIRLKGKGAEAGFEEVFVVGNLVITHGKFDVLAFDLLTGAAGWRFQVPFDFDLKSVCHAGPLLILSGATNTVALQTGTGEAVWNVVDRGELYTSAFVHQDILVSPRREPFGVTFRHVATGRLLRTLNMPDLSMETRHPVLDPDVSRGVIQVGVTSAELPVAYQNGQLLITDGAYYISVDVAQMAVSWKRAIDNVDRLSGNPIRFYLQEPYLLVLKRDFKAPALYMLDSRTGAVKWVKKDAQAVYSIQFSEDGKKFMGLGIPEAQNTAARVKSFDSETGNELAKYENTSFTAPPDLDLLGRFQKNTVVMRAIHGENLDLMLLDMNQGKLVQHSTIKAVGEYRAHGGRFAMLQGPHLVLMNAEQISVAVPGK
jgi:outer membrane protein assembly factor BamB/tetratricopeptide (TPR) repeat protein